MIRFFKKIILFLLAIVILDSLFGYVMDHVLRNTQKGDWGRSNYIMNEANSDIVILGSSRAIHHYDPVLFADSLGMTCYNSGEDGMGILLMYARYRAIRDRKIPRVMIYEVLPDFDLLCFNRESSNQKYLKFLRPYKNAGYIDSLICNISSSEEFKLFSGMYRYNSIFADICAQRISRSPDLARDYTYGPLDKTMKTAPKQMINDKNEYHYDPLKLYYLEEMIMSCKLDGTILIFTASPIFNPASDVAYAELKNLCKKHSVPFINHFCDPDYVTNMDYFADSGHLNRKGAEVFSAQLASELKAFVE